MSAQTKKFVVIKNSLKAFVDVSRPGVCCFAPDTFVCVSHEPLLNERVLSFRKSTTATELLMMPFVCLSYDVQFPVFSSFLSCTRRLLASRCRWTDHFGSSVCLRLAKEKNTKRVQ